MLSGVTDIVSCFVLAGGASSRMQGNKSFLKLGGKTIIEIIISELNKLFPEITIITNTPEEYEFLHTKFADDILKGKGPISGIHSGLYRSKTERNLFLTCDMPLIDTDAVRKLLEFKTSKPVVVFKEGNYVHPLPGIYSKSMLAEIEEIIKHESGFKNPKLKLLNFLHEEKTEMISIPESNMFFNMNTPDDYEKLKILMNKP